MLVIGTFEHSIELEQCLAVLEKSGVLRQNILVVSMDTIPSPNLQDLVSQTDRYSRGFETGMAFATAGAVVGTSVGFRLEWGPIFWGVAAAAFCFAVSFGVHQLTKKGTSPTSERLPEVTVIIQCLEDKAALIGDLMWQYRAISVGRAPEPINSNK